jgi:hypothetical protein
LRQSFFQDTSSSSSSCLTGNEKDEGRYKYNDKDREQTEKTKMKAKNKTRKTARTEAKLLQKHRKRGGVEYCKKYIYTKCATT